MSQCNPAARYFGVSGKGIAHLIITLPKLTLLVCEPYLMREAIKFLYPINVNSVTYSLLYLHARFPSREFLLTASAMCPRWEPRPPWSPCAGSPS